MRVRTYLIFLILGYSICGLTVFFLLNMFYRGESQLSDNVSRSRLILRDIESLERNLSHWMLLSDLVLGADESYLCDGAIKLGGETDSILNNLANEVDSTHQANVLELQKFSARQKSRLVKARTLDDLDRQSKLDVLLTQMDTDSEKAIEKFESFKNESQAVFEQNELLLDESLSHRNLTLGAFLLCFLGISVLLWLWISSIVSRPISTLAQQSRIKDGSVRNFRVKSTAPHEVQQLAASLSELVTDLEYQIHEHKKTQIERTKLHHKLMDASRRAGMADVASEVLHNVGNVLNSLNVSATVMRDSLEKDLSSKLAIANREFANNASDYGDYLDNDEKGKHFPAALNYISDALVSDHGTYLNETQSSLKNISHITNVIHRQLSMSRDDDVIETFCLFELIEDCIAINRGKSKRLAADVTLECPKTLNLETDRHKLQQLLINLISNALDAVEDNSPGEGLVEIAVSTHGDEFVNITVVDNGSGILQENLDSVFLQGFTTKVNGHGYGLHSCALAAQVLGGNLNVASDGAGRGACFQLEIAIRKAALCKV